MNIKKELLNKLNEVKPKFILTIFSSVLSGVITVVLAFLLSKIINDVFLLKHSFAQVTKMLYLFLFFSIIKTFIQWLEGYFASEIVFYIKNDFRKKIFSQIGKLGHLNLKEQSTGELANTLIKGVDKLEEYFSKFLPQMFSSILIPVIILIFIIPNDYLTAIIFVVTAPIIPLFMFLIGSIAEKMNKKQWETLSKMSAYFLDVLFGLKTLKLFNKTTETISKIFEITDSFRIRTLNVLKVAFLSALVLEIAATISVAVIAVSIGIRLINGQFDFANALFILIIAPDFYLPLRKFGASYHAGMEGAAAYERISELLNTYPQLNSIEEKRNHLIIETLNPSILFYNVSYKYPTRDLKALDNINLKIGKNKITALVGISGSGKSTLMNTLLRFINPDTGEIRFGENKLEEIDIEVWREKITWLPQNPHIYHKSILENILISKPDADIEDVFTAAKKAKIHERILQLPNKYYTIAGENGQKLSGGEVQRIALARAYLRNSSIILVDEPTANLDPIVEEEILNDLYTLFENKTVLIIAHRLNTIIKADQIVVMKNGKVIESGTYHWLINSNSYFKEFLEIQNA